MRKIILQEWISLDGFAADSQNSSSFMETQALNRESDMEMLAFMDTIDAVLLGANTYRLFAGFWPTPAAEQELVAEKVNTIPKYVFSKSLEAAPWGNWPAATLVAGDAVAAIKEMKSQPGKDIALWGSISLAQSLMNADLIDDYDLRIVPTVLGKGRALFEKAGPMNFDLYQSKQYASGLLLLQYRRKK